MKFLIGLFAVIIAVIVLWKVNYPSGSWRYKITVEVETPEGIKSGSAVREVNHFTPPIKLPDSGCNPGVRGEAVIVDLGQRGMLFTLIDWSSFYELLDAFPSYKDACNGEMIEYYNRTLTPGKKAQLTKSMPQMVMFKNLNDPMSVTLVRGGRFNKDTQKVDPVNAFETIFGSGVKLKEITIEITNEPVTWGIEKILPWLPERRKGSLDGRLGTFSNELPSILHYGNFKYGEEK